MQRMRHVHALLGALILAGSGWLGAAAQDGAQEPKWPTFTRPDSANPVISPRLGPTFKDPLTRQEVEWEIRTTNPSAVVKDGKVYMFYQAEDRDLLSTMPVTSRIGLAISEDGLHFKRQAAPVLFPANDGQKDWEAQGGCRAPRVGQAPDGSYVMIYAQGSAKKARLAVATSKDLFHWKKEGPAFSGDFANRHATGGAVVCAEQERQAVAAQRDGKYFMAWADENVYAALSEDLIHWTPALDDQGQLIKGLEPRKDAFDNAGLEVGPAPLLLGDRVLMVYTGLCKAGKDTKLTSGTYAGTAVFDLANKGQVLARSAQPYFKPEMPYESTIKQDGSGITAPGGAVMFKGRLFMYYGAAGYRVCVAAWDPKGAPIEPPPTRKAKRTVQPQAKHLPNGDLLISSGGWEMAEGPTVKAEGAAIAQPGFDSSAWYDAVIPGTAMSTLVEQGMLPEPYYGLNNLRISEKYCRQDYWYRTQFSVPTGFIKGQQLTLNFGGINYRAQVWLNGQPVGNIDGAFIRGAFDVTKLVKSGAPNALAVHILPPPTPAIPHEQSLATGNGPNGGPLTKDGPTFFATQGWDWIPGIRDRSVGIWQAVTLSATGPVTLGDTQIVTDLPLPDTSSARVKFSVELKNNTQQPQEGSLVAQIEGATMLMQNLKLAPAETKTVTFDPDVLPQLTISNPRLWWPNGYGKQELYDLNLRFNSANGTGSDHKTVRFGIREITYGKITDELVVLVNGQKIMCQGGNWGADDAMKRMTRERMEACIRLHRDANVTMVRNWTGQDTSEDFYEFCDKYGILIWNDFWLANPVDGPIPADNDLFLKNAADVIKRYRNHPSIALWCGRNEGVPPEPLDKGLRKLVAELDGTRMYQPDSADQGVHGHGPYQYQDPAVYFAQLAHGFTTEIGLPSVPVADTIREMMPKEDQWPIGDSWAYHDFCAPAAQNYKSYIAAMDKRYGKATSLGDFCRKAQMLNYDSYRAVFEAWHQKLWRDCAGVMLWMSHPAWPSTVWQLYSYDLEPTAALWGVKKGCEPLHIQMSAADGMVAAVNNSFRTLRNVTARATVYSLDLKRNARAEMTFKYIAPNTSELCFKAPTLAGGDSTACLVKLELNENGNRIAENFYWYAEKDEDLQKLNDLPKVTLDGEAWTARRDGKIFVRAAVSNPSQSAALMTHLTLRDVATGKRVLPAFFSDNYISLLPGEKRDVTVEADAKNAVGDLKLTADGWNIEVQEWPCIAEGQ